MKNRAIICFFLCFKVFMGKNIQKFRKNYIQTCRGEIPTDCIRTTNELLSRRKTRQHRPGDEDEDWSFWNFLRCNFFVVICTETYVIPILFFIPFSVFLFPSDDGLLAFVFCLFIQCRLNIRQVMKKMEVEMMIILKKVYQVVILYHRL